MTPPVAAPLAADRVHQRAFLSVIRAAEHHKDFFRVAVHSQQRKQVRLVEDSAADVEDRLHVPADHRLPLAAEHLDEGRIRRADGAIVREADEARGERIQQRVLWQRTRGHCVAGARIRQRRRYADG